MRYFGGGLLLSGALNRGAIKDGVVQTSEYFADGVDNNVNRHSDGDNSIDNYRK